MRFLYVLLVSIVSSYSQADSVVVHKNEQASLNSLMRQVGINHSDMKIGTRKSNDKFSKYINIKDRYYYKDKSRKDFWFVTNSNNKISALKISWTNLSDLTEISNFSDLKFLQINSNLFENVNGLKKLKNLMYLDVSGNDKLVDIGGINNLPNLIEIDAVTLKNISIKGMKNLPKLERFLCDLCLIDDIAPLSDFTNLKILKMKTSGVDINSIRKLKNLEFLRVEGENLEDISSVNAFRNIEVIYIPKSRIKELKLDASLSKLRKIIIGDSNLRQLPNVSGFKSLKELTVFGTEIGNVDTVHNLENLEELSLVRNKNMRKVINLRNLPNLKQLELENSPLDIFETSTLPSLEELKLSKTNINNLINFEKYPSLRRLIINDTKITSLKGIEKAPMLHSVQADYDVKNDPENEKILRSLRQNIFKRKPQ